MFRAHLLLGCEGSVDHKHEQGAVEAMCQCLRAGKQENKPVFKSLHLLFNLCKAPSNHGLQLCLNRGIKKIILYRRSLGRPPPLQDLSFLLTYGLCVCEEHEGET